MEPPIFSIKQICRETGLPPMSVINAILSPGTNIIPVSLDNQTPKLWLKETLAPQPSKTADQLRSKLWQEGQRQRYQRRSQFPESNQPKTIRRKAESRISAWQLMRVRVQPGKTVASLPESPLRIKEKLKTFAEILVIKSQNPEIDETIIKDCLETTSYWSGSEKQIVTPDVLAINQDLFDRIQGLLNLEAIFLARIFRRYQEDVKSGRRTRLTAQIEGSLENTPMADILRQWCLTVPADQLITYFRPDLGLTVDKSGKIVPYLCELNIITAGTPPAMLYRQAQEPIFFRDSFIPAAPGSTEFFWEKAIEQQTASLAIVGVTPLKPNQKLYEKSHTDMARILEGYGIDAKYVRISDLVIEDDQLFFPDDKRKVESVYWRIPPFQEETLKELGSSQGQLLLQLYRQGLIQVLPSPFLMFMNNKALEEIVWDPEYRGYVPDGLRNFVPETDWVAKGPSTEELLSGRVSWQEFVLKTARGDGGVLIGAETRRQEFLETLEVGLKERYGMIIQKYLPPIQLPFRIRGSRGQWRDKPFYLRLEPTVAVKNGKVQITDLFFTGRYDTRKVGGSNNCIMGIVAKKETNE